MTATSGLVTVKRLHNETQLKEKSQTCLCSRSFRIILARRTFTFDQSHPSAIPHQRFDSVFIWGEGEVPQCGSGEHSRQKLKQFADIVYTVTHSDCRNYQNLKISHNSSPDSSPVAKHSARIALYYRGTYELHLRYLPVCFTVGKPLQS